MLSLWVLSIALTAPVSFQSQQASASDANPLAPAIPIGGGTVAASSSSGQVNGYDTRADWIAAVGATTTLIDFESVPAGTVITDQFASLGVALVEASSLNESPPGPTQVGVWSSANLPFPMFNAGTLPTETHFLAARMSPPVYATGSIAFNFSSPVGSVGAFIADQGPLDGMQIELFDANGVSIGLYVSQPRTLPDSFVGVTSTTLFSRAVFMAVSEFDSWGLDNFEFSDDQLGLRYCSPAVPNSTGLAGELSLSGSAVAADNDLTLTAANLPTGFGFFIASRTQGFGSMPGGSQGNICISGNAMRFASQTGQSVGGSYSIAVDLTSFPEPPTFSVAVMPGDTFNFQFWHRDAIAGTPTSNFTDAVELQFL